MEQAIDAQECMTVQRSQVKIAIVSLMLLIAWLRVTAARQASGAWCPGVVRDAQGVAQMGALVQVMAKDSAVGGDGIYGSSWALPDCQSASRKV